MTASGAGVSAKFVLERRTDKGRPIVQLRLVGGDFSVCGKIKRQSSWAAKAKPQKRVRRLYAQVERPSLYTATRRISPTDPGALPHPRQICRGDRRQGAVWLTADRCDGTLAQVRQGTVSVRDLVKKKTVVVRAGHSYLAKKS